MSFLIMSSDILLERLDKVAKNHAERNITMLKVLHKADKTIHGDDFKGRNEVIM